MTVNHSEETHRNLVERVPQVTGRGLSEWFHEIEQGPSFSRIDERVNWLRDEHELHEALLQLGLMPECDEKLLQRLIATNRAARYIRGDRSDAFAAERLSLVQALDPNARIEPVLRPFPGDVVPSRDEALLLLVRGILLLVPRCPFAPQSASGALPRSAGGT